MRRFRIIPVLMALATGPCGPVSAAEFEASTSVGFSTGETTVGIASVDATVRVPLGEAVAFEFGAVGFVLPKKHPHETYAALTLGRKWQAGVVRPAYDMVLPSVFAASAPYVDHDRMEYARAKVTVAAMRHTAVPLGLSYRTQGATGWAASLHDGPQDGATAASFAAWTSREGRDYAVAVEALPDGRINAKAGLRASYKASTVSVAWLHPDGNDRTDTLALSLDRPAGRWHLGAMAEATSGAASAYGVSATRALDARHSLTLAATRDGGEARLHVGLVSRF